MLFLVNTVHAIIAVAALVVSPVCVASVATHYGEDYNGQQLGCAGSGLYESANSTIVAVGYNSQFKCNDHLLIGGPLGTIETWVSDTCPGCVGDNVDLSEAGIAKVCGEGVDICEIVIIEYEDTRNALGPGVRPEAVSSLATTTKRDN